MADDAGFCAELEVGDPAVLRVRGEIDVATAPGLRAQLLDLLAQGHTELTLDMSGVTFIDSTGMSVVMAALKRFRERSGDLRLRAPSPSVRLVLEFSGLSRVLHVED